MSLLSRLRDALLPRTTSQIQTVSPRAPSELPDRIPPFQLQTAELMRFDPQLRIGLGARNGLLLAAQALVASDDERVARWVQQQWDRLWSRGAQAMLRAKLYGFLPFEVSLQVAARGEFAGLIEARNLRARPPRQSRLLVRDDELCGFVWRPDAEAERRLLAPQALVCTYGAEFDVHYGCSLLERAYPAWYEKYCEGGVKQTLKLRMVKDAYLGDVLWYPPDHKVETADGRSISWRDIAREVVESRSSGGALTLPMVYDDNGKRLVDYTPPRDTGDAAGIFRWKRDNDIELWKALEVPPEILEASASGSGYSGRWIPFTVAVSAVQSEFAEIVECVERDILRPLVQINFGPDATFEISPQPLQEVLTEAVGKPSPE